MANPSSADVEFAVWGGYDIHPLLTQMSLGMETKTEERTTLGDRFVYFNDVGIRQGTYRIAGFFDDGATGLAAVFNNVQHERLAAIINIGGNVLGGLCVGMEANTLGQHAFETPRGEFVKANGEANSTGIFNPFLRVLYPKAAVTANFTAAPLNEVAIFPAPTAFGGVLYYSVTELDLDGGTNLTLSAESGDGAVYAAITGSSRAYTTNGTHRIAVTGTIGTRVRLLGAWTGGGAGKTAQVVAGWERATA